MIQQESPLPRLALALILSVGFVAELAGCSRSPTNATQIATDTAPVQACVGCGKRLPENIGASACSIDGELPGPAGIELVPTFKAIGIEQPIHLTHPHDGTDRIVVATRLGLIWLFKNDPEVSAKTQVLDIRKKVSTVGEGGLLSVAYHPSYDTTRRVYVNYTTNSPFRTVVSEFTADESDVLNPASERVLLQINQPYSNHDGGHIWFDATGKLMIGMGDGGAGGDPQNAAQNAKNLLGKILRIDVNTKGTITEYAIPADNPFVGDAAYAPEIWALGMRNPWRCTVDRLTGEVWCGDVGQNAYEEIDIIVKGANYGWRRMEGLHCYNPSKDCDTGALRPPVAEIKQHPKDGGSITGGDVYRGSKQPGLYGAYIFADWVTGQFWLTRPIKADGPVKADGKVTYDTKEVLDTNYKPVSFGEDRDGEVYMLQLSGSATIFSVRQKPATATGKGAPATLSKTSCFASLAPLVPGAGLLPYDVNAPLWSDGAGKARWLVMPKGAAPDKSQPPLTAAADGITPWQVPVGAIAIKHFYLGTPAPGEATHRPVETRFIQRRTDGWRMLTYAWRADGKDADLVMNGLARGFKIPGAAGKEQVWQYPTTNQCGRCHAAENPSKLLGVHTAQLDRVGQYGDSNQLTVWAEGGLLAGFDPRADPLNKGVVFADPVVEQGTLAERARTYLHVQCASCHQPGSSASTELDLRYGPPLAKTRACDGVPQHGDEGVAGAKLIHPGKPDKSVLWLRMQAGAKGFMPEVGVSEPHGPGSALIKAWIAGLSSCLP